MTDLLIATAIRILAEDKCSSWCKTIQSILPNFRKDRGVPGSLINVTGLLSHKSGHTSPDSLFWQDINVPLIQKGEEVMTYNYSNQPGDFRQSWLHNSLGYAVIGLVIETLSGQTYGEFLGKRIFEPLGLRRTTTEQMSDDANVSKYYSVLDDRTAYPVEGPRIGKGTLLVAAGGVNNTVTDLLRLYQSLLEALNDQTMTKLTSSDGLPFRQCCTMTRPHNLSNDGASWGEKTYGLGCIRCALYGILSTPRINSRVQMIFSTVGTGSSSRLCLSQEGLTRGFSTNI